MKKQYLEIEGAREHNLKNISLKLPLESFIVITGLSGSGKSSLAFDTIYAEGQRRYIESLSAYARQFLGVMNKPDVDAIHGLSPAIAIEQKTVSKNPRSTVGTITEIYDYLRLLFARVGHPHCPNCGKPVASQSAESIVDQILMYPEHTKIQILSPLVSGKKGSYEKLFLDLAKDGFSRIRVDGWMRNLSERIVLNKNERHTIEVVVDRIEVMADERSRINEAVETALEKSSGLALVALQSDAEKKGKNDGKNETLFSSNYVCVDCGRSYEELQPRSFSFNSPFGACERCHGLGTSEEFDMELIIPDAKLSIRKGAIAPWGSSIYGFQGQKLQALAKHFKFSIDAPFEKLDSKIQELILNGSESSIHFDLKFRNTGSLFSYESKFEGVIPQLKRLLSQTQSEYRKVQIRKFMIEKPCVACGGKRLKPESLAVLIEGKNIHDFTNMAINGLARFIDEIRFSSVEKKIAKLLIKEIKSRLSFLLHVGLDYLTLDRRAASLSGGEGQRIRLATQIGSELRGVMYILDEPSIGLHQRDNHRLIESLQRLRDLGNTLIVVEHDADTIMAADYVVDIGPGAGRHGGAVVAKGTPEQILKNPNSLTGEYLSKKKCIPSPKKRRKPKDFLEIIGASEHNLKDIDVSIPLGVLCAITGVSGSGKSTLINETLSKALAKRFARSVVTPGRHREIRGMDKIQRVITVDQSPIGRTPRSNPMTYIKVFDLIRDLFSKTKEAKTRGYGPGRFSFNLAGGRCENCEGDGVMKIEMHFLPDVFITCEKCKGKRYNRETLEVKYREKSIADILDMTASEALHFFEFVPPIQRRINTLCQVGLGYLRLGQSATTLSGGEAQRIKLTLELAKMSRGHTLYILDEPTTGLHFEDIKKLLDVLQKLVDKGNTVLVIEHNLDVIKVSDWIIDMGPEGGDKGGGVVYAGDTPGIVSVKESFTGQYLKKVCDF